MARDAAKDIRRARARAHRLAGHPFGSAVEAVRWFGVIQAQDPVGAGWGVAQRTEELTESRFNESLDRGEILRTHVLRPTWHLVLPEDATWMLQLTGRRIQQRAASIYRRFGIDAHVIRTAERSLDRATRHGAHLTRAELATVLRDSGVDPTGQRLPHLLGIAELDRVLISGSRRGKQPTWAAFDQRVSASRQLTGDAALAELAVRYFRSHGPAAARDFAWWAGLSLTEARRGISAAGGQVVLWPDAPQHWVHADAGDGVPIPAVMLLPNWDEFTVAYRDRDALLVPGLTYDWSGFSFGSILANAVLADGMLVGTWRRQSTPRRLEMLVTLQAGAPTVSRRALEEQAVRMGAHVGLEAHLTVR